MKGNSKLAVAVALVALMVLLVAVFGRQQAPESARENALWLPELKPALPELRKVALQSSTERPADKTIQPSLCAERGDT